LSSATDPSALLALWSQAARSFAHSPALLSEDGGAAMTYAEADTAAEALAQRLREHAAAPGDAVMVALGRGPAWLAAILAVWKAGCVMVPATDARTHSAARLAALTGARLEITGDGGIQDPEPWSVRALGRGGPRHPALVPQHAYAMSTSGSTGDPKLALVTHRTSAAVLSGLQRAVGIEPGERAVHAASFAFSSSIRQLLVPLLSGATVAVVGDGGGLDPRAMLAACGRVGATSLDLTPTHIAALTMALESEPDAKAVAALRRLLTASETLAPALAIRWMRAASQQHVLFHLYGQTETGGAVSALAHNLPPGSEERLALGVPFAPFTAYLRATHETGTARELLLAGLDAADGLLTDTGVDRSRYEQDCEGTTGLYSTGDLFDPGAGGTLLFRGRLDADTKILGVRVDTAGLEARLAAVPGVEHVAAVPTERPDGSRILTIAYTAPAAGPASEIAAAAAAWLGASVAAPRTARLEQMPVNNSGKIDRARLSELLSVQPAPADPADPLAALWARHIAGPAQEKQDFFVAGGDSLSMIGLLADIAAHYGTRILPEQFHRDPTLTALRAVLTTRAADPRPSVDTAPAPRRPEGPRAATAFQRGLWIGEQLTAGAPSPYWLPVDMHVAAPVDRERMTRALRATAARFDVLRCAFTATETELIVHPDAQDAEEMALERSDDGPLGPVTQPAALIRLAIDPRAAGSVLMLRVHHAVTDRPGLETVLRSLTDAYNEPSALVPLASSFLDYADAQTALARGEDTRAAAAFWAATLPPPLTRAPWPGAPTIERTAATAIGNPGGPGATRHAAWLWAFHRALAAAELPAADLIGIDVDTRPPHDPGLVGPCVATLPLVLPSAADDEQGPREVTSRVAQLLAHAAIPLDQAIERARRPTRDPRQPFFLYHLVYQKTEYPRLQLDGAVVRYTRLPRGIAEHTVTLFVREHPGQVELELAWDSRALGRDAARSLVQSVADRVATARGQAS
jgi:acyl-coenzyme A synthetase/AMP-(fatty) acid ligase